MCSYANPYTKTIGKNGQRIGWRAPCLDKEAIAPHLRGTVGSVYRAAGDDSSRADKELEARESLELARVVWAGASPITVDDPACRYLARRAALSYVTQVLDDGWRFSATAK